MSLLNCLAIAHEARRSRSEKIRTSRFVRHQPAEQQRARERGIMWLWRGSKRNPLIQIKIRQEGGGRVRGTSRAEINKHDSSEKISSFPSSAHIDLRSTCARARSSARRHRFPRGVSQPISRFTERRRKNRKKTWKWGSACMQKSGLTQLAKHLEYHPSKLFFRFSRDSFRAKAGRRSHRPVNRKLFSAFFGPCLPGK